MEREEEIDKPSPDELIERLKLENSMLRSQVQFLQEIIQEKNHELGLG